MKCGLLGRHLGHSYSPQIHAHLGDYSYILHEKEPEELADFLRNGDFSGLNVTIPYKKDVIPFCGELTDCARKMGAVNTIVRRKDGSLVGHNTDYFGFHSLLRRTGLSLTGKKALVLGSGGASNTAAAVLRELGVRVVVISRRGEDHYGNLDRHRDAALIVNATPVGMYPHPGEAPVDLRQFPGLEGVVDMIYNPARTRLLMEAEELGLVHENGLWMLIAQAKESAEWFTGRSMSDACIAPIYQALRCQMENIILIGMPGCGKSTVGQLLAQKMGRRFADADQELEKQTGRTIPEIFSASGEACFRALETDTLSRLGMQSGLVIATGGGCVTRAENYPLLHQNGTIFHLTRPLSRLSVEGRPLSQTGSLEQMFRVRSPLYQQFSDCTAENTGDPAEAAARIEKMFLSGGKP